MKMYLRPCRKMEVVAASGETSTFLYFSLMPATDSVTADE